MLLFKYDLNSINLLYYLYTMIKVKKSISPLRQCHANFYQIIYLYSAIPSLTYGDGACRVNKYVYEECHLNKLN